jgi:alcohol dehydrogenase
MVDFWSYYVPTKVIFGVGSVSQLKETVDVFGPDKILLVAGKQSMKKLGIIDKIVEDLKAYPVVILTGIGDSPKSEDVSKGVQLARKEECGLVLGIGGGSAIDLAKTIATLSQNSASVTECLSGKVGIANRGNPIIAIPTTAGTGSEVTQYASIIHEEKKISLNNDFLRPNVAILDPSLTATMPKFVTATTGLDALSQCIEAYWAKNHTPISDLIAVEGIKLIFENLLRTYEFPAEIEGRSNMLLASLFSGIAISVTKTTIVHSVSYPLTVHFNVPHGLACSLTLPLFVRYNSENDDGRILKMANCLGERTVEDFVLKIESLIQQLKLPNRLGEVGVKCEDIDLLVKEGFRSDRASNNPRVVTAETLRELLNSIS